MVGDCNLFFDLKLKVNISNTLQEFENMREILTPLISADHSLVLFSLSKEKNPAIRGEGFGKFNSSLSKGQNYMTEIKKLIYHFSTKSESIFNCQVKQDLIKYQVKKCTIKYMKHAGKEKGQQRTNLD